MVPHVLASMQNMFGINGLPRVCGSAVLACVALCLAWPDALRAGSGFATLLSGTGQDFATAVTTDGRGNVYAVGLTYSADFAVTAGAQQTVFGQTCDAFIAKLAPDGERIWVTYLGGILDDWATGVAVDRSNNVWVTGWTRSANFPLLHPLQSTLNGVNGDDYDAFVAKYDANGKLLFSTFLGGNLDDGGAAIATDAAGNAYVAVNSNVQSAAGNRIGIWLFKLTPDGKVANSYLHAGGTASGIAVDAAGNIFVAGTGYASGTAPKQRIGALGTTYALVFKTAPDFTPLWETALGGSADTGAAALALDGAGNVVIAGSTTSVDLPLVRPLQTSPGARPIWRSGDAGASWSPLADLPFAQPVALVFDPLHPATVYAASKDTGVWRSVDAGATWTSTNKGIGSTNIVALAIDPRQPQTLYAVTAANGATVYRSTDGAATWTVIDKPASLPQQILVDGQNSATLYEVATDLRRSTDGGATWSPIPTPFPVQNFALDPRVSGHLFLITQPFFGGFFSNNSRPPQLWHSEDGGANWTLVGNANTAQLLVDPSTNPSTVYNWPQQRSIDGGLTWSAIPAPPFATATPLVVDAAGRLYAAPYNQDVQSSGDRAQTWADAAGAPIPPAGSIPCCVPAVAQLYSPGTGGTLYGVTNQVAAGGFVAILTPDGANLRYSTYLRAHASEGLVLEYLAEPGAMFNQSWISGLAIGARGEIVVAGGTRGTDLPVVNGSQAANAGVADAFAAALAPDGSEILWSTYTGGGGDDGALAVTVDAQGSVILAGQTWSPDFPAQRAGAVAGYGDAFIVKMPGVAARRVRPPQR